MFRSALPFVVATLLLTLSAYVAGRRHASRALVVAEQNVAALADSVRVTRTHAGHLEAARLTLVAERDELHTLNRSLAGELHQERGHVLTLTRIALDLPPATPRRLTLTTGLRRRADGRLETFARMPYAQTALHLESMAHPDLLAPAHRRSWRIGPMIGAGVGVDGTVRAMIGVGLVF
ncbi:MAG: hypothetical protein AAGI08_09625 [Bacteroidota bacterium]